MPTKQPKASAARPATKAAATRPPGTARAIATPASAAKVTPTPPAGGDASSGPLLLLDGMSLGYRAYFALPPSLITSAGIVTNAVHGFTSMLTYLVRDHRPSGLAVAFDLWGPTFRDEIAEDYKAGRAATPDDLTPQFDMIRAVLHALSVPVVDAEGFEADDVLATLATEARDRQCPVIVVTGDRDCFQLVEDPYVKVLYNRRGVSDYALYDEQGIVDRTGVRPDQYPILAALRGDPSDNLTGVPGVGEKTAAKLVNQYGSLDALFGDLDSLSGKLRDNLAAYADHVRTNAEIIPLIRDVPLDVTVEDLHLGGWDVEQAKQVFAELELRTLWTRLSALMEEGSFGPAAPGGGFVGSTGGPAPARGPASAHGGASPEGPALSAGTPSWFAEPAWEHPATADEARAAVSALLEEVHASTGNLVLAADWSGQPGRSSLVSLALAAEATEATEAGGGRVVHLGPPPVADAEPEGPDEPGAWMGDAGLLGDLREALAAGGVGVVAHDAKELMRSLLPLGVDVANLTLDTAVGAYLLDPSVDSYRLADLAQRFLAVAADGAVAAGQAELALDDSGSGDDDAEEPVVPATVRNAAVLARLRLPLEAALDAVGAAALNRDIEQPLVRVLARMEVVGIRVDGDVLRSITTGLADECRSLEATIQELAGTPFKVNSVPQLRAVLYEKLGLTPVRKTKTGFSTDARTLEQLRDQHPIVEALLRYREVEKLRSTYGESLVAEVAADGRIHATFRQTVARTGRLSSDRPNLHNIPVRTEEGRRFREAFVPSEGRRLLVADYDQVELRAIAHLSGDSGLTAAFAAGEDIHRTVAARVFGIPPEDVTGAHRSTAKMVSYGLAYGMESYGLSQRLGVPVEEAQEILSAYFEGFPYVRDYMERAVAEARTVGYTVTAFGRRRPLPDLVSTNYQVRLAAERQAMNAGIQGLAADLFKLALIRLDRGLEEGGFASDLVLQVHDEVLLDVEPAEADAVAELTEQAMVGAADLSVPLEVEMSWGASWADAKGN
jgi:DNA polymerase I